MGVTGTSSGKTLCYQIPILDDLLNHPEAGLRAVIIYPLVCGHRGFQTLRAAWQPLRKADDSAQLTRCSFDNSLWCKSVASWNAANCSGSFWFPSDKRSLRKSSGKVERKGSLRETDTG